MNIQISDLKNAGLTGQFIDIFINNLNTIFKGGDSGAIKDFIQGHSLTDSQKRILAEFVHQEYAKMKGIQAQTQPQQYATVVAIGAAVGWLSTFALGHGLKAVGFTTTGIAKASIAAGVQSALGNVQAGSVFALLQSVGAQGLLLSPVSALCMAGVGAGVAVCWCFGRKYWNSQNKGKDGLAIEIIEAESKEK